MFLEFCVECSYVKRWPAGKMVHICEYLAESSQTQPNRVLTLCEGRQQTARKLLLRGAAFAAALQQQGLQSGDVVMLAANSSDHFLESLLAIASIGCIVAPVNLRWDIQEASKAISLCQASTILVDTANMRFLAAVHHASCSKLQHAVILGDSPLSAHDIQQLHAEAMISRHMNTPLQLQHAPHDAALICFTSGTTGQPKAALISHTALDHQSAAKIEVIGYHRQDCYLHTAPLFHIGGMSSAMAVLKAGGTHVFMGKFSARATLEAIRQHQITAIIAVPAMVSDLATEARASPSASRYPSMERVLVGAGAISQALQQDLQRIFPNADCFSAYGMTEACSSMTFRTLCSPPGMESPATSASGQEPERGVCVGLPPSGIEMAVLTGNDALQTSPSASSVVLGTGFGEILTKGPHVFTQYLGQPTATRQAFLPGSWFRTGDMGSIDAKGRVWLNGRSKDIVRTGGETVHPSQVEAALLQHPSVTAAAVFGLPHDRLGEQVAAVIVLDNGVAWDGRVLGTRTHSYSNTSAMSSGRIVQFCRLTLSAYKVPRVIVAQYEAFPLNASGKVMKLQIRQQLLALLNKSQDSHGSNVLSKL